MSDEYWSMRDAVLRTMTEEVMTNCQDKGWYEDERTFGDDIALLHSEVSEMLEAFRDHGFDEVLRHENCTSVDVKQWGRDEPVRTIKCTCIPKPLGVGSEAADVLIRLLDTCGRRGIDLAFEYRRKMAYNRTRPHRHGGKAL